MSFSVNSRAYARAVVAGLISLFFSASALAGSFQVTPISVTVPHGRPIGAITVKNESDEPVSIRVLTFRWTQEGGEDVHTKTAELLASPPIFTIPARGTQLVRVGLAKPPSDGELAYRVILEEIPRADPAAGLRVTLRLSIPFYKQPKAAGRAETAWSATRFKGGAVKFEGLNSGALHDHVIRIDAIDERGARTTLVDRPGVVLPGSRRHWPIAAAARLPRGNSMKLIVVRPSGEQPSAAIIQDER